MNKHGCLLSGVSVLRGESKIIPLAFIAGNSTGTVANIDRAELSSLSVGLWPTSNESQGPIWGDGYIDHDQLNFSRTG